MGRLSRYSQIEVAVYKGDEMLCSGRITECARQLEVQPETLYFYTMPSYERRIARRSHSDNARRVVRI